MVAQLDKELPVGKTFPLIFKCESCKVVGKVLVQWLTSECGWGSTVTMFMVLLQETACFRGQLVQETRQLPSS